MTEYRLKLEMNIGDTDNPEWSEVTGRIFETDKTEEDLDRAIRKLEEEASK